MKGDIVLAGFLLTAEEWQEIDPESRAQLMAEERRFAQGSGEYPIPTMPAEAPAAIAREVSGGDAIPRDAWVVAEVSGAPGAVRDVD